MKQVRVEEAVGMILCHDITRVIPGVTKERAFKKGHVITPGDIPLLLQLGKDHIYVWEADEDRLHENDAAQRLATAAVAAPGEFELTEPNQGCVHLVAAYDGLLKVNSQALMKINLIDDIVFATRHGNQRIRKGEKVAGTRVIPLVIDKSKIVAAEEICRGAGGIISLKPLGSLKVGVVTTGNEVFYGRIQDGFGPVLAKKLGEYGSTIIRQIFVPDSEEEVARAIKELLAEGAQLILTTGGMSVDPDDVTPRGIKKAGGRIVSHGAPVLPGSMFLVAYIDSVPVLGLPACTMYNAVTIFDLVLPRILAGEEIKREDLARLGEGGLCLDCPECHYPICPFGKA